MFNNVRKIRSEALNSIDFPLVIVIIIIVTIGISLIYSAGFDPIDNVNNGLYKRQILWFIFGFVLMIGMTFVNYQSISDYSLYIYISLVVLLLITLIFGKPVRNSRAWLNLGVVAIQPSEFMKLGLVIILAKYLEIRERDISRLRELLVPTILTLIPLGIILKQPDLGTAMIFIPLFLTLLFVGGADISHLISIVIIAIIAIVVPMIITYREWVGAEGSNFILDFFKDVNLLLIVSGILLLITVTAYVLRYFSVIKFLRKIYLPGFIISMGLIASVIIQNHLQVFQKRRILVFLNPDLDPQGSGYNIIQSKIAIGSGGFFGRGFLHGSQSQLGFLPEKSTDFIFAVLAEEWGFIGAIIVMCLLGFIIYRGIETAMEAKDKFGALLASGITMIFFYHIFVNIGMTIGIMPVTGHPLCFVSYGGSNLIMSMICVGILINIRSRKSMY
jgi:rod shape determining protein RodA